MANCEPGIQWMWNGFGPCDKPICFFFVIEVGPPPILRGTTSPHGCVENAVRNARQGNRPRAIRWLQAGQSHNGDAQRCYAENQDEVLEYIVRVYGPGVPLVENFDEAYPNEDSAEILRTIESMGLSIEALEGAQTEALKKS